MALCRDCSTPIPCHCHVAPAVEIRPGVYRAVQHRGRTLTTEERRRIVAANDRTKQQGAQPWA